MSRILTQTERKGIRELVEQMEGEYGFSPILAAMSEICQERMCCSDVRSHRSVEMAYVHAEAALRAAKTITRSL